MGSDSAVVVAVGDMMFTRRPTGLGDVASSPYETLRKADLALGNLEQPMTGRGAPAEKSVTFRSPPELVPVVREMGIGCVSLANNHMLDYGVQGLLDTVEALQAEGIACAGAGASLEEAFRPALLRAGGLDVAVLSFSCTLPPASAAGPVRPGIAPIRVHQAYWVDGILAEEQPGTAPYVRTWVAPEDVEAVSRHVGEVASTADYCIVCIHWGVPPWWHPMAQGPLADFQQPLGRALLKAGADAVIGHHPHVVHGVESWEGRPIAYSLGNFVFHAYGEGRSASARVAPPYRREYMRPPEAYQGCLLLLRIQRHRTTAVEVVPIQLDQAGEPAEARDTAAGILARMARMSADLGTELRVSGDRAFLACGGW